MPFQAGSSPLTLHPWRSGYLWVLTPVFRSIAIQSASSSSRVPRLLLLLPLSGELHSSFLSFGRSPSGGFSAFGRLGRLLDRRGPFVSALSRRRTGLPFYVPLPVAAVRYWLFKRACLLAWSMRPFLAYFPPVSNEHP